MIQTKSTRPSTLTRFVPAGKLSHSYSGLLPVIALCLAGAAWSQRVAGPRAARVPHNRFGGAEPAQSAAVTPASARYRFITIEIPGATGNCGYFACNVPYGINDARLVTGLYHDDSNLAHGFAWQNGISLSLDYPGAADTYLDLVNNQGVVIGDYENDANAEQVVTYSFATGAWTMLPDVAGYPNNNGYGINDFGFAVGNAYSADFSTSAAWVWDPSAQSNSIFAAPESAQNSTGAYAVNDEGQVVGVFTDSSGVTHGFLKAGTTYTTIDPPDSTLTNANAINNRGTIVGAWENLSGWWEGFIRTSDGVFTILDVPGALETQINGINDRGDLCGVAVDASTGQWTPFIAFKR